MASAALTLLALAACSPPLAGKGDTGADSTATDCEVGAGGVSDISVESTDMPTVLRVRWTAGDDAATWVAFSSADAADLRTPAVAGTGAQEALLFGLTEDADVSYRVAEDDGGTVWCGETRHATTGSFGVHMPDIAITGDGLGGAASGLLAGPIFTVDTSYVALLNRAGRPVWMVTEPIIPPDTSPDPVAPVMHIRQSRDGLSLLFNGMAVSDDSDALLYQASLDGSTVTTRNVTGGHTDFAELPDGTILMLGWDVRNFDSRVLVGDTLVAVQPDGSQETVWDAFDVFPVDLSNTYEKGYYYANPEAELWTHISSIRYDEGLDALILTMTMANAVFVLDRETYALKWTLAESSGDFRLVEGNYPGPLMSYPHSAQMVGDNVLVFSRGDPYDTSICAEASEIALDMDARTAEKVWSWKPDNCLIVPFLGDAQRLDNGDTLVNFASLGQIDEVSAQGDVVVQYNTAVGAAFGFVDLLPSLYTEE